MSKRCGCSQLLLQVLPEVFSGKYAQDGTGCMIQNNALAVHAAKMSKEEGELWFTENAVYAHNKVIFATSKMSSIFAFTFTHVTIFTKTISEFLRAQ